MQFLLNQSSFFEKTPHFEVYTPKKERALANDPPIVDVGLSVRSISYMNMKEGRFKIEGTLWFLYKPGELSLKTIESFDIEKGVLIKKSEARTKLLHQKILASFDVTLEFLSQLEHKNFPIADHRVFLIVKMGGISKSELTLNGTHTGIVIAPDVQQQAWKLNNARIQTGYYSEALDKYNTSINVSHPIAIFSFDFENPGFRVLLLLLIPEFILFLFGLFSLIIPFKDAAGSINLSIGSISGLIVHRFVVESISPDVGYFTFFDKVYIFFLLANLSFFLLNIALSDKDRNLLFKNIMFYVTQILFIIYVYGVLD
ncbi:MAG: hypothetical protein ACTHJ4_06850 [Candidatus Nucleicultricaceae bacterium]